MKWKKFFNNNNIEKKYDFSFFEPATSNELDLIEKQLGVQLSGDLYDLLMQTNGVFDSHYNFWVIFNTKQIIERNKLHLEFLKKTETKPPNQYLFFADNGCSENFGFIINNGILETNQIGIYYPVENEFTIKSNNLEKWVLEWCFGEMKT